MHAEKFRQVIQLPPVERYGYFVRKVADTQLVWGLHDEGWATAQAGDKVVIPFWPEADFAQACASGGWAGYQPRVIALDDFLHLWLPGMQDSEQLASIFAVPQGAAAIAAPADLLADLQQEAEQYE